MKIEVIYDEVTDTYSVSIDGSIVFECMSANEIGDLTLKEIVKLW